jgi:hypothetical protein
MLLRERMLRCMHALICGTLEVAQVCLWAQFMFVNLGQTLARKHNRRFVIW